MYARIKLQTTQLGPNNNNNNNNNNNMFRNSWLELGPSGLHTNTIYRSNYKYRLFSTHVHVCVRACVCVCVFLAIPIEV